MRYGDDAQFDQTPREPSRKEQAEMDELSSQMEQELSDRREKRRGQ